MNTTFVIDSLCKTYISHIPMLPFGKGAQPQVKRALSGVSLTLTPGLYGLLGPNGAGKSTLIHIITGTLAPDSGEVLWCGKPAAGIAFRRILGYMPQQQGLYDSYTGRRFLAYMAALKEIPRKTVAVSVGTDGDFFGVTGSVSTDYICRKYVSGSNTHALSQPS